jgi:hypothetical protein
MKTTAYVLSLLLLAACNNTTNTDNNKSDSITTKPNTELQTDSSAKPVAEFPKIITDSVINQTMPQNGDTLKVSILKKSSPITCNISIPLKGKLYGAITTATNKDNIRFNQIIMPDGSADGPFERTIQYDIKKPGNYKLIIASNLMAENPYTGEFELSLVVK